MNHASFPRRLSTIKCTTFHWYDDDDIVRRLFRFHLIWQISLLYVSSQWRTKSSFISLYWTPSATEIPSWSTWKRFTQLPDTSNSIIKWGTKEVSSLKTKFASYRRLHIVSCFIYLLDRFIIFLNQFRVVFIVVCFSLIFWMQCMFVDGVLLVLHFQIRILNFHVFLFSACATVLLLQFRTILLLASSIKTSVTLVNLCRTS